MIFYRCVCVVLVVKAFFITSFFIVLPEAYSQDSKAQSFHQQGREYAVIGDFDKAREFFMLAIQEDQNFAPSYNNLGLLFTVQGKYDEALKYFDAAERIYTQDYDKNIANLAGTYNNKGILFKDKGDYFQALKYYNNALNLFLAAEGKERETGRVYNNLGLVYLIQNSLPKARDAFLKSIEIKAKYEPKDLSTAYSNLARVCQAEGDYEEAEKYYLLSIDNKIQSYGEDYYKLPESYINYGQLKILQGSDSEGVQYFSRAADIYIRNYGDPNPFLANVYLPLGNYYLEKGDNSKALRQYQKALVSAVEGFSDTNILINPGIANITAEVRLLNILRNKATALYAFYRDNPSRSVQFLDECLNSYDLVIDLIEKMRGGFLNEESKLFLTENARDIYNTAVQIAYAGYSQAGLEKYKFAAFDYAEKGKAALVSSALSDLENKKIYGIPVAVQQEEKDILAETDFYKKKIYEERQRDVSDSAKINLWQHKILDLSKQYDSLLAYLHDNFPEYYALKYDFRVITVPELQDMLDPGEAVVEYTLTDTALFIMVIKDDYMELARKDIDPTFYQKLDYLITFLKDNGFANTTFDQYKQFVNDSYHVFGILFEGVYANIKGDKLTVIPDDKLGYLPFESMLTEPPDTSRMDFRDLKYMIYNNQVNYSYSATLLVNQEFTEIKGHVRLAAFAPTYDNLDEIDTAKFLASRDYIEYLVPLKYLKDEVRGIADVLGAELYIDYDATEEVFWDQAGNYDILHFAMHTLINDANPMFSQLVFTLTNDTLENKDGLLNTYEVYNMELNARMAVLSACNTGFGRLQRGEGIMSLARGFIYAGVPSIIMTLWAVEDQSGSSLMIRFYKFLAEGDAIDEALRKAKLEYLAGADQLRAHPYLWASYVSIGRADPICINRAIHTWYYVGGAALILICIVLYYLNRRCREGSRQT